ncbi:PAS domain-containing sensor histidine kinase [Salisaeta longa]|uniref:PAS domain-containing sensor histidine kinase n=1 Tax=Salisaeta longa TaxID=503170 RepID=UPI0003B5A480|nr:PAS domain S-box protein [Salisaeta longa]
MIEILAHSIEAWFLACGAAAAGLALQHQEAPTKPSGEPPADLLAHVTDLLSVYSADGTCRYTAPSIRSVLGYAPEDVIGTNTLRLVHPDDHERVREGQQAALKGENVQLEVRVRHADGRYRWIELRGRLRETEVSDGPELVVTGRDVTQRREQEEALERSKARWQRLVENHMAPILITVQGTIRYINDSGARYFGAEAPEELIGRSVLSFVDRPTANVLAQRVQKIQAGQPTAPYEHALHALDGTTRRVSSYSVPIQYEGERAAQTVVRDVTDWRRTQANLRYRIHLEHLVVDLSTRLIKTPAEATDALVEEALGRVGPVVGADRAYVFQLDAAHERMSNTHEWVAEGVSPEKENLQDLPFDALPWWIERLQTLEPIHLTSLESLPPEAEATREVLQAQSIQSLVVVPMTSGGALTGFVGFDAVQRQRTWTDDTIMVLRVLGDIFTNALERKRSEEVLRKREARYRTVVENVHDVVFRVDAQGRFTFLNDAWPRTTGFTTDEALHQPLQHYLDPPTDTAPPLFPQRPRATQREARLYTAEGDTRWVQFVLQPVQTGEGAPSEYVGTLHDITGRKQMEEQTREALARERELSRLQSSLVSMVSHEFQTPLATIRSSAEMIAQHFEQWGPEKREKYLRRIRKQVDRMSRLMDDMITTSRLDAKHAEPKWDAVAWRAFVEDLMDDLSLNYAAVRRLEVQGPAQDTITADSDLLYYIASNLTENALKYSPNDTTVRMALQQTDERLRLTVSDNGYGIASDDQEHLLEPFYRGKNVEQIPGSGLGLTIVQRAVNIYGGTLAIEGTEAHGTTVTVDLPLGPALSASGGAD